MTEQVTKRLGGGFPLWALILIAAGVVLLLNNFGVLPWGVWGTLWRFWPVLLVLIGLNIIWGRSHPWASGAASLVIILIVLGIAIGVTGRPQAGTVSGSFSEPLGGLERATVEIEFGAGDLVVDSLIPSSANLMEGEIRHTGRDGSISKDFDRQGNSGTFKLSSAERRWRFWERDVKEDWGIYLSQQIPLELTLKTGASTCRLDLTDLKVTRLQADVGASSMSLQLPAAAGTTDVVIKAGAAGLDIRVPNGVAAKISLRTGVSSVDIDTSRFPRSGDYYMSPDYATAANRVNIELDLGASSVDIR